jgi:hypothetical protein
MPSQPITRCGGLFLSSQTTRDAEIERITIPGQPRQKVSERNSISVGKKS